MPRNILLTLCLLAFALAACSLAAPTVAEEVDFAAACDNANKGQRVAVQGYLRLLDSFAGDLSGLFRLYETADMSGTPIGVQIRFGTEANQVEMVPAKLSDEDLKVHLLNGQLVEFGTNEAFRFWQAPLAGHEPAGGAFLPLDCLHVNPALAARLVIKLLH